MQENIYETLFFRSTHVLSFSFFSDIIVKLDMGQG